MLEALAEELAQWRAEQADDLERSVRTLSIELGELRTVVSELRVALAAEKIRGKSDGIVDLPNPISPRRVN
jgi:hypothetical protein